MEEKNKKKEIVKISVFITSLFVIFLSVTYAFINQTLTGTKRQVITAGNLQLELQEDENNLTIQNALPMYDEVGMIQDAFTFRLINKTSQDTNYILKLEKITVENPLDPGIVKYGLTKDEEISIDFVSNIVDNTVDTGIIKGNQTIEYSLRLWIDSNVENLENINQKRLSYRLNIEAGQNTTVVESEIGTVTDLAFKAENLGDSCKTYNDGVDTFLVGQCQNNYVWYSGKLWRVVLKNNETGAVKMVTDNSITTILYNESSNTAFENSNVDQWLSQEFLPTLHDTQDYLVIDSVWDLKMNTSGLPTRPDGTTVVNRTVGLLNLYEYNTTYNHSDGLATEANSYLNNGVYWWTITSFDSYNVWYVREGGLGNYSATNGYGIRPSVNLKSDVQISSLSGNGTISSPYRLIGDRQETINGSTPLNTRYSGEYVKFNNELYRIVDIENSLTKITAVDKLTEFENAKFHTDNTVTSFANASIKTDLENYYQGLNGLLKNMIEPNTVWYLGMSGDRENYKSTICASIDINTSTKACEKTSNTTTASIGLPRVGEIFTSQITRKTKSIFWTITPLSSLYVRLIRSDGTFGNYTPDNEYGIHPSMYLKQNVVIAKDNTGDGTFEHPYEIELGS